MTRDETERETLASLIDACLDGDSGHGMAALLADKILADGYRKVPRPVTDEVVLAALNATVKPESRAPDLSFWAVGNIATMRASLEAAEGARR